jgi:hypothetical protein
MTRLWLEPGYDHGRFGAWLLDLPGCFLWRTSRNAALAAALDAERSFIGWLGRHGEPTRRALGPLAVIEEVPALDRAGYEVNATFDWDREGIDESEVDRSIRWLGYVRDDLLGALDSLPDPPDAPPGTGDERLGSIEPILRHLAGAEVWLAGRLDPSARYDGPLDADGPAGYLAATRAWAVDRLRQRLATDPNLEVVDRRGESWTLRKVLRRLIYHSHDHLAEITRSVAPE